VTLGLAAATDRVVALAVDALPTVGPRVAVAIDGRSGAGKTTLGRAVAAATRGFLLSMEDIYPGWDGLAEASRRIVTDVLQPLSAGEQPSIRRWDWGSGAARDRWPLLVPGHAPLVIEGVGSSPLAARPYLAVRVWLDGDPVTRRRRALARDGETYAPHWQRWAVQEEAYLAAERPDVGADVVITALDGP